MRLPLGLFVLLLGLHAATPFALAERGGGSYDYLRIADPRYSNTDPIQDGSHDVLPFGHKPDRDEVRQTEKPSRIHVEGIQDLKIVTKNPLNVGIYTKFGNASATIELSTRHSTDTVFEFTATDIRDEDNIWDERGRAVLVPGNLVCRVTHRGTIADYQRKGLTLGLQYWDVTPIPGAVQVSVGAGGSFEELNSDYFEQTKRCPVGPIPAMTSIDKIKDLCKPCLQKVLPTLKQDVDARMKALSYLVSTPICQDDKECTRDSSYWTQGRCVVVKDKNDSYYSECRARSKIGGTCGGEGSSGMFEYKCDKGLECKKVHEGKGFWNWSLSYDYSRYECRDPQRPNKTKPD